MSSGSDSASQGDSRAASTPPSSLPPASPRSRLCDYCELIPFGRYLGEEIPDPISLGRWTDIRESQTCPFCRLVAQALTVDPRQTPRFGSSRVWLKNDLSWKLGIELSPYDRSKSLSYSNKFDLRSKAKESYNDAFRFIIEVEEKDKRAAESTLPRKQAYIQYLAHREKSKKDQQFFGRKVNAEAVDGDLLKPWLKRCSKWHFDDCQSDSNFDSELLASLRLIDIQRDCIIKVDVEEIPEFVALSYVWGKEKMKRDTGMRPVGLERKHIVHTEDGEATPLPGKLPRTIRDAITLTKQLGYRFLWVDALCIAQDTTFEDKLPHLTNMKAVYNCSSLTIAAAAGEHADHGLPGISVTRKYRQYSELVRGLRLATMSPSFSELENSSRLLWNTRGWTFQEKLLSRRLLLFTDYQVYFKCSESIWTEEVVMETDQISKSMEAREAKYRWLPGRSRQSARGDVSIWKALNPRLQVEDDWNYLGAFLDYASAVQEYTKRSITDPRDSLFAIDGVLDTMEDLTDGFTVGLPRRHFLEALLWYPDLGSRFWYNDDSLLPTWSWASYTFEGRGATFDLMDVRQMRAIISIATERLKKKPTDPESSTSSSSTSSNNPDPVKLTGTFGNLLSCLTWSLLRKDNTIRRLYYSDGNDLEKIAFDIPAQALQIGQGFAGAIVQQAINYGQASTEKWRPSRRDLPRRSHVLAFKTVVVRYRIGKPIYEKVTDSPDEVGVFELLNSQSQCVGEITTSYRRAFRSSRSEEFVTISWGLALRNANVHSSYVPKWRFSSEGGRSFNPLTKEWKDEPEEGRTLRNAQDGVMELPEALIRSKWSRYIPKQLLLQLEAPREKEMDTKDTLFEEVYMAKKGEPRPRSLWSVVNLILVDRQSDVAFRAGVGKVLMAAWQEDWNAAERIFLG